MKNTDSRSDKLAKQAVAEFLGITIEQLEARIAVGREVRRIVAVETLRAEFPAWSAEHLR